jgi:SAM-dependent methyltransferase
MSADTQIAGTEADQQNAEYWETLCGTPLAKRLGATDFSHRSLALFDAFFMGYYPYLQDWLRIHRLEGKDVLEIGLGMGTVSQWLAASRARYTGLDVAKAPVEIVNERLKMFGLPGKAVQGSILNAPFENASFDHVVAIGCLHHTGDIQRALKEVARVLRPGGSLMMMVYYAYSYRMMYSRRLGILRDLLDDLRGKTNYSGDPEERFLYDNNDGAVPAPHTVFVSKRQLRRMARAAGMKVVRAGIENAGENDPPFQMIPRDWALKKYAKVIGTDLYAELRKTKMAPPA